MHYQVRKLVLPLFLTICFWPSNLAPSLFVGTHLDGSKGQCVSVGSLQVGQRLISLDLDGRLIEVPIRYVSSVCASHAVLVAARCDADSYLIKASPQQRFYDPVGRRLVESQHLKCGHHLLSKDHKILVVTGIEICELKIPKDDDPYNAYAIEIENGTPYVFVHDVDDKISVLATNGASLLSLVPILTEGEVGVSGGIVFGSAGSAVPVVGQVLAVATTAYCAFKLIKQWIRPDRRKVLAEALGTSHAKACPTKAELERALELLQAYKIQLPSVTPVVATLEEGLSSQLVEQLPNGEVSVNELPADASLIMHQGYIDYLTAIPQPPSELAQAIRVLTASYVIYKVIESGWRFLMQGIATQEIQQKPAVKPVPENKPTEIEPAILPPVDDGDSIELDNGTKDCDGVTAKEFGLGVCESCGEFGQPGDQDPNNKDKNDKRCKECRLRKPGTPCPRRLCPGDKVEVAKFTENDNHHILEDPKHKFWMLGISSDEIVVRLRLLVERLAQAGRLPAGGKSERYVMVRGRFVGIRVFVDNLRNQSGNIIGYVIKWGTAFVKSVKE